MSFKNQQVLFWHKVFELSSQKILNSRLITLAILSMGVPIFLGMLLGYFQIGLLVGFGAILFVISSISNDEKNKPTITATVLPPLMAIFISSLIAGKEWADLATVLLITFTSVFSSYSRPLAFMVIRFGIYLVLCVSFIETTNDAIFLGLGIMWNIILNITIKPELASSQNVENRQLLTPTQRRTYFLKNLQTINGWQFPLRLLLGLGFASILHHSFATHHFYWIMLIVMLLTQRTIELMPVIVVQRVIGTIIGILITDFSFNYLNTEQGLAIFTSLLAILLPISRAKNYLLYSIVITPLILLVFDLTGQMTPELTIDRLIATLAGAFIVIFLNSIFGYLIAWEGMKRG